MDVAREGTELREGRFDGLHAEAKAALADSGTTIRAIRDRYREAYHDEVARWQALRDELNGLERGAGTDHAADRNGHARGPHDGAARLNLRRSESQGARVEALTAALARHEAELNRLELVQRTVEDSWRFREGGGVPAAADEASPLPPDMALRIIEAQESERSRLAQDVHDGPAQALTNAIFQVEYIERVIDGDSGLAQAELRFLRELLRRELGDVRAFISQLRPRVLDQLGLEGSIRETVANLTALTGLPIEVDLKAPGSRLNDTQRTVVLRLVQEALQNVRKHAGASHGSVSSRLEDDAWVLEIRDDGRGFDVGAVGARGRRNFGLQFMRERAELIGARFEVRSRPDGGTVVWLAIPLREEIR